MKKCLYMKMKAFMLCLLRFGDGDPCQVNEESGIGGILFCECAALRSIDAIYALRDILLQSD